MIIFNKVNPYLLYMDWAICKMGKVTMLVMSLIYDLETSLLSYLGI